MEKLVTAGMTALNAVTLQRALFVTSVATQGIWQEIVLIDKKDKIGATSVREDLAMLSIVRWRYDDMQIQKPTRRDSSSNIY